MRPRGRLADRRIVVFLVFVIGFVVAIRTRTARGSHLDASVFTHCKIRVLERTACGVLAHCCGREMKAISLRFSLTDISEQVTTHFSPSRPVTSPSPRTVSVVHGVLPSTLVLAYSCPNTPTRTETLSPTFRRVFLSSDGAMALAEVQGELDRMRIDSVFSTKFPVHSCVWTVTVNVHDHPPRRPQRSYRQSRHCSSSQVPHKHVYTPQWLTVRALKSVCKCGVSVCKCMRVGQDTEARPVSTASSRKPDTQESRGNAAGTEHAVAAGA